MPESKLVARESIKDIIPYEPGKPIVEVQHEFGLTDVIKLASNENPLGPSPKALEAVRESLPELHRYPDGGGYYLKRKLADRFGVDMGNIVLGNGSAELVELVTEAFVDPGDEAVIGRQAFFKYRIAVQIMGGRTVWARMPDYKHDAAEMLSKVTPRTKVLFVANPNNPTGTLMDKNEADELMNRIPDHVLVVFDEAYYDYRDPEKYPDTMRYLREDRNVAILRTFSKSYGLAALRIGYALAPESVQRSMNAVREAFNVNAPGQIAAVAALDDDDFLREGIRLNEEGKRYFYRELERLGVFYVPTEANFVMVQTPMPGREFFHEMLKRGVIVRPIDGYGLPEFVRVSIGLPKENERFFREFQAILAA